MTDSNDQDRKKVLSLSGKGKLELKNKPAADNSVRQSFSHGRSKTVTVEVKRSGPSRRAPHPVSPTAAPPPVVPPRACP